MCILKEILSHPTHLFPFSFPEYLRVRSHDPEEAIRHDVIVSIVTAAKKDLSLVNDALLNFVKERTLDKRVSGKIAFIFSCFSVCCRKAWVIHVYELQTLNLVTNIYYTKDKQKSSNLLIYILMNAAV